jgi:cell division protein ZapA
VKAAAHNTVTVTILDKDYQVACPAEKQAALQQAAQHLDQQMNQIRSSGKVIGIDRIAVMAALNISHEMLELKKEPAISSDKPIDSEHIKRLDSKIDAAIQKFKQLEIE